MLSRQETSPGPRHGLLSVHQLGCVLFVVQENSKKNLFVLSIDFMISFCWREAGNETFQEYSQSLIPFLTQCFLHCTLGYSYTSRLSAIGSRT